jgi:murein DD-endopeptidase MepM/ murein hydrolase activator NlpD
MARLFLFALAAALFAACAQPDRSARAGASARRAGTDVLLAPEFETIEARVPRRATLDTLLRQHQLSAELVVAAVQSAASVFNPRQLRADRPYRLVRSLDGFLHEFEYQIDADRFLRIIGLDRSQPHVLDSKVLPYQKQVAVAAVHGAIDADHPSLIAAIDETGERVQLAMSLAEIFGGQIDFESDLQQGDTFDVLVEKSTRDGEFAGYGAILGARFTTSGRQLQAFRWTTPGAKTAAYYDENGRSLKRFFLRSPLRFEPRVTSGFSRRRFHPVHRSFRPHLGVDYGAPHGSAVVSVAAGTVVSAGWAGGGGRTVRIRHASGFESYYLHLASFAKGIRAGAHVDQGQVIGRVGSSGTATGPHLDYRLRKNGIFVNPLAEHRKLPPGEPIPGVHLASFRDARDGVVRQLSSTLLAEAPRSKPDAVTAVR